MRTRLYMLCIDATFRSLGHSYESFGNLLLAKMSQQLNIAQLSTRRKCMVWYNNALLKVHQFRMIYVSQGPPKIDKREGG